MSCFIMETRATAALARGLETVLNQGYNFAGFDAPQALHDALENCRDAYGFYEEKKIFAALYDLNVKAFAGRYDGRHMEEVNPAPDWPQDVPRLLNKPRYYGYYQPGENFWKYYKLLDCFIYQTSEDATDKTELYNGLVIFSRVLASYLVRNCAAYNGAPWGSV